MRQCCGLVTAVALHHLVLMYFRLQENPVYLVWINKKRCRVFLEGRVAFGSDEEDSRCRRLSRKLSICDVGRRMERECSARSAVKFRASGIRFVSQGCVALLRMEKNTRMK